uniref:ORF13 n=1 Tax=Nitrosopumilaceae spindle-shaped virus TaxID=3065433 RepID=A0AAT9J747_9VIRU
MPIEQKVITIGGQKEEFFKPITTKWKGIEMIRNQTPKTAIHSIAQYAKRLDYVKIGIVGDPHTGKTTLAKFLAHFLHLMCLDLLGITYVVKIFTRDELLSFKKTIEALPAANYIFIFDDVSWIEKEGTPQQINELKAGESMIRHFKDKKDVKIIQIDNYHYTKAENKYLRQSHFKIFTAIGSEEEDNINSITKNSNPFIISQFAKLQTEMYSQGTFTFLIGKNRRNFTMRYRDPFIPVLFWDGRSLRFIVTPEREWMDRGCAICSMAEGAKDENFSLDKFKQDLDARYGEIIAKNAIKIKMKELGLNTYRPELTRAVNKISKTMTEQNFDLLALGQIYGLKLTPPPKRIKLDKLIEQEKDKNKNLDSFSDKNIVQVIPWEDEEREKPEVIQQ